MIAAVNQDIPNQNSTDPTVSAAAINDEVTTRQTFDTSVSAITFPAADQADAQAVINADAALEADLGTLAANTNDVSNYNSIFTTVLSAQSTFTSADAGLSSELGLVNATPS